MAADSTHESNGNHDEQDDCQSRLLQIPAEIREIIYRDLFSPASNRHDGEDDHAHYDFRPSLGILRTNRQIHKEARKVFRDLNIFIRVQTPWPEAEDHVSRVGHVPIICTGLAASRFDNYSLLVSVDAPEVPMEEGDEQQWVILLDDLGKFTQMWYYSNLSHDFNRSLRMRLHIRDANPPAVGGDAPRVSKQLQRRLLLPFRLVKDLQSLDVSGDPKPFSSIVAELREAQAEPNPTAEHCLRECVRLKLEGNAELAEGRYEAALDRYSQAWRAIHIIIKGRERHIHGDRVFARNLVEPPFEGKNGQTERLILRIHLVANTCFAYLKLNQPADCHFWGLRTINMLRQAMGIDDGDLAAEDEAVMGFPAAVQMGKIYYRTGLALMEMDRKPEARNFLRVAAVYLPNDEGVKRGLAACALRLG